MASSFLLDALPESLTDEGIVLRPFTAADAEMIERVRTDETIGRWMSVLPRPAEDFLCWADEGRGTGSILFFAICEVGDHVPRGGVATSADADLRAGMGYWLLPEGRGRGLATRALRLLSNHVLHETQCQRCELWVDAENLASRAVAERAGYRFEGLLRSYAIVHDRRADAAFYSLLASDLSPAAEDGAATNPLRGAATTNPTVRDATHEDGPTVRALWRHFRKETPEPGWRAGNDEDHLCALTEAIGSDIVLLAELDGELAGLAVAEAADDGAGYLHILFVPPTFRRSGVAAALLREVAARLRRQGMQLLGLDVLASNTVAREVYGHWGFTTVELTLAARLDTLMERL